MTGLTRLSGTNGENSQNEAGTMSLADASQSTKATGETEIFEVTTENTTEATTEKTTTAQTSADVESGNYVFAGAKSYQEIFDALKKTESGYGGYETAELARGTTNDYMVAVSYTHLVVQSFHGRFACHEQFSDRKRPHFLRDFVRKQSVYFIRLFKIRCHFCQKFIGRNTDIYGKAKALSLIHIF